MLVSLELPASIPIFQPFNTLKIAWLFVTIALLSSSTYSEKCIQAKIHRQTFDCDLEKTQLYGEVASICELQIQSSEFSFQNPGKVTYTSLEQGTRLDYLVIDPIYSKISPDNFLLLKKMWPKLTQKQLLNSQGPLVYEDVILTKRLTNEITIVSCIFDIFLYLTEAYANEFAVLSKYTLPYLFNIHPEAASCVSPSMHLLFGRTFAGFLFTAVGKHSDNSFPGIRADQKLLAEMGSFIGYLCDFQAQLKAVGSGMTCNDPLLRYIYLWLTLYDGANHSSYLDITSLISTLPTLPEEKKSLWKEYLEYRGIADATEQDTPIALTKGSFPHLLPHIPYITFLRAQFEFNPHGDMYNQKDVPLHERRKTKGQTQAALIVSDIESLDEVKNKPLLNPTVYSLPKIATTLNRFDLELDLSLEAEIQDDSFASQMKLNALFKSCSESWDHEKKIITQFVKFYGVEIYKYPDKSLLRFEGGLFSSLPHHSDDIVLVNPVELWTTFTHNYLGINLLFTTHCKHDSLQDKMEMLSSIAETYHEFLKAKTRDRLQTFYQVIDLLDSKINIMPPSNIYPSVYLTPLFTNIQRSIEAVNKCACAKSDEEKNRRNKETNYVFINCGELERQILRNLRTLGKVVNNLVKVGEIYGANQSSLKGSYELQQEMYDFGYRHWVNGNTLTESMVVKETQAILRLQETTMSSIEPLIKDFMKEKVLLVMEKEYFDPVSEVAVYVAEIEEREKVKANNRILLNKIGAWYDTEYPVFAKKPNAFLSFVYYLNQVPSICKPKKKPNNAKQEGYRIFVDLLRLTKDLESPIFDLKKRPTINGLKKRLIEARTDQQIEQRISAMCKRRDEANVKELITEIKANAPQEMHLKLFTVYKEVTTQARQLILHLISWRHYWENSKYIDYLDLEV